MRACDVPAVRGPMAGRTASGTRAGYLRHQRANDLPACDECTAANAAYLRDWAAKNPGKRTATERRWREKSPAAAKESDRRRRQRYKEKDPEAYRRLTREWYQARYVAVSDLKIKAGCIDCGFNAHPHALDFDHRPGEEKSFTISRHLKKPWDELLAEIAKCDVRCRNCHAIVTDLRRKSGPYPIGDEVAS